MLFVLCAGELSGDTLGAGLILSLKKIYPDAKFTGIAGPKMQAAGCESLFPMESLSVMGLVEIIKHLPAILKIRKGLIHFCLQQKPIIYIGIDAPDFNLGVAKKLKASGIKTVQYVSPSIWAWREGRIHHIKKATDLVLCLLPFETKIYAKYNHLAKFVGHPQADAIPMNIDQKLARNDLGLNAEGQYLAILPGSRHQELQALLKPFLETAAICKKAMPKLQFILPLARESLRHELMPFQEKIRDLNLLVITARANEVMAAADVILVASGTATLESMFYKKPMVVAYRLSSLSYFIARFLIKVKFIALPNLLANKKLVPEFIQNEVVASEMAKAVMKYFTNVQDRHKLIEEFSEIHQSLQCNASAQAALAVAGLIG